MRSKDLILRSLAYYWRTNVAVVAGVATAVAVLAGALLVGDSVRGSLRDLSNGRMGRTDQVVVSSEFFREQLADDLRSADSFGVAFSGATPLIVLPAFASEPASARRVGQVRVYGVDDRFWQFHGIPVPVFDEDEALLSAALAEELRASAGNAVLVRVQRPSEIPLESLQGRKDGQGSTLRLNIRAVIGASELGDFSLDAQQGDVRAMFVQLSTLQRELDIRGRINTILISVRPDAGGTTASLEQLVRRYATLDDLGLSLTSLTDRGVLALNSGAGLLTDAQSRASAAAIQQSGMTARPVFTYLANTLRHENREVPYSLVTALDLSAIGPTPIEAGADPPIVLNEWAARELQAAPGDAVTMEYYRWEDPGRLVTDSSAFRVAGIVPVTAGDRNLAPAYPGISEAPTLANWDPPFPIDLRRIRPADEVYWEQYRTTPKAFIPLATGQQLWQSRYGSLTSIRIPPVAAQSLEDAQRTLELNLREHIDPLAGIAVRDVRASGMAAARGATDFGAYFVYFSFFIVVSALLLAALFFKLGIEQRAREVGLLRAVGLGPADVRRLFLGEGILLALCGSVAGVFGAIAYAALLMTALRSWWVDAVGTEALTLHVSAFPLIAGAVGGTAVAVACIWWTLRGLAGISERSLLAGQIDPAQAAGGTTPGHAAAGGVRRLFSAAHAAIVFGLLGVALLAASAAGAVEQAGGFFGAGSLLLVCALCIFAAAFRAPIRRGVNGRGWQAVSRLGLRNTTYRPGRSVLSIAVVASATFILISVDAFRRDVVVAAGVRQSGLGGYTLVVDLLLPVVHDPNTREGREVLNLSDLENVTFEPFRLLPGDDASCLNLYAPQNPQILAPRDSFLSEGRFVFQESLAATDTERSNPWLLLKRQEPDGAVPVIADANSMTYVLHRRLGEDVVITHGGRQIRLRLVAALRDSILQGELLMSQDRFVELFPEQEGYQLLLVETSPEQITEVASRIEDALADFGADATSTVERLATYHRVENTYLSTFQTLGGLGLLLGTVGLATVMLRNAMERRRELGLLGAVGYQRRHFLVMAAAENALLLTGGLIAGGLCAALAVGPAIAERGGRIPLTAAGGLLIFAVFVAGLLSSLVAARVVTSGPLVDSLKTE